MKLVAVISYGTLLAWLVLMTTIGYWLYFPYNPVEFIDVTYDVKEDSYKQGEVLEYKFRYCAGEDVTALIRREFVNDIVFLQTEEIRTLMSGCGERVVYIKIPYSLPPGEYSIRVKAKVEVNPIRHMYLVNNTETFKVLPR